MKIGYIIDQTCCVSGPSNGVRMQAIIWAEALVAKGHHVEYIQAWGSYDWKSFDVIHLICVFALSIFYYPIGNFLNYHDNKYLKVSLVLVIVWILSVVFYNYIPSFCLKNCQIQRQFIPFGVGLLFNKYEGKASINKISICGALSLFVSFIINKKFGVWIDNYSEVLRIIDGCLMAIFCFSIFKLLSVIIRKISFVNGILCYFGKNTLEFYLLHMFIAALFPWKSFMVLGNENFISIVVFLLLTCITSLLLAILRFAKVAKFLFVE